MIAKFWIQSTLERRNLLENVVNLHLGQSSWNQSRYCLVSGGHPHLWITSHPHREWSSQKGESYESHFICKILVTKKLMKLFVWDDIKINITYLDSAWRRFHNQILYLFYLLVQSFQYFEILFWKSMVYKKLIIENQ